MDALLLGGPACLALLFPLFLLPFDLIIVVIVVQLFVLSDNSQQPKQEIGFSDLAGLDVGSFVEHWHDYIGETIGIVVLFVLPV